MANEEHSAVLVQGVGAWNEWRKSVSEAPDLVGLNLDGAELSGIDFSGTNLRGAILSGADLTAADLGGADLGEANLRGAILRGADLTWTYLGGANLIGADLGEANLNEANLTGADLSRVDLCDADLTGSNLRGVNFFGADLRGASLQEATVGYTKFGDVDLSEVRGLTQLLHLGPSTIGIDTVYRSRGDIPDVFLRGAGVPENFIDYVKKLTESRNQIITCYISSSSKDKRFCVRLHADLQSHGVRTWYATEDSKWGKHFLEEFEIIDNVFEKIVLICSRHSLQSRPVLRELERALKREYKERKQILFPVQLDNYLSDVWKHPAKEHMAGRVVSDFRGWNRSARKYDDSFKNLFKALSARQT